ncbi:hypothetical protein ECDEC12B_5693 [Escherichia coli DEC12B]|nr:hypothetical protein ECDEC12B_5693 [Escherichia coli DEC12B]EHX40899.1 hypothetical protein ECDEC12C_5445 [Escherichia coli DEC12C]
MPPVKYLRSGGAAFYQPCFLFCFLGSPGAFKLPGKQFY